MATALYRRYRPESFAEVIGQDHVTTPLRRALRAGRVGHAYLFSGPRGCGKTTSARILARCLNCEQGPTDTPCGTCDSCRDLARGGAGSLDVVEIDAASHGGVDDARELRERASFAPVRDRFKVFIIDEAHMVTSAGFNALLKLVEEPPDHVKFVFATTEPDKVIGTIRSRTHHYPFRLIPPQVLGPYLEEVCAAEDVQVGEGVMPLVVRAGGGSARDSMSVLDQLMAGAGEDGLDFPTAIALLGFTDTALLDQAVAAVAERDAASLYSAVEHVLATGHEPRRFVEDLLERMRDLIVLAAVPDKGADLLPQVPAGELERMRGQAAQFAPADLSQCGDLVHETLSTMTGATSPRLHLELLAARLVLRDERAALAATDGPAPQSAGPQGAAPAGRGGVERSGAAPVSAGGGREEARRIAQERAEAARQARGGGRAAPASTSDESVPAQSPPTSEARPQGAPPQSVQSQSDRPQAAQPQSAPPQESQQWSASSRGEQPQDAPAQDEPGRTAAPVAGGAAAGASGHDGGGAPPQEAPSPHRDEAAGSWGAIAAAGAEQNAAQQTSGAQGAPSTGGGIDAEAVRGHWSAILDELQQIRRPSWALISQNAQVNGANGNTLVLGFRTEGLISAFRRGTAAENLADAVRRIMHIDITVDAVVGEDPGPSGAGPGGNGPSGAGPSSNGSGAAGPGGNGPGGSGPGGPSGGAPGGQAQGGPLRGGSAAPTGDGPAVRQAPRNSGAAWGDAVSSSADAGSGEQSASASQPAPADQTAPVDQPAPAAQTVPVDQSPSVGQRASERAMAAAARAARNAPAGPTHAPADDFPPEPDDPYPPDPEEYGQPPQQAQPPQREQTTPPGGHGRWSDALDHRGVGPGAAAAPTRPAREQEASAPSASPGSSADQTPTASTRAASSGGAPLEVEDEGRDSLPAEEPRTFGQNALKRALAEGRVVRSLPAAHLQQGASSSSAGAGDQDGSRDGTVQDGELPADPPHDESAHGGPAAIGAMPREFTAAPEVASPSSPDTPPPAGLGRPSSRDTAPSSPQDGAPNGSDSSAAARAAASWGAAASVTGAGTGAAPSAPSASTAAPATPSAPGVPRSGAALVREAAMASRTAGQRVRGGRREEEPAPEADLDPTGGATRDDEDAVVATRNGREVIEKMLGGKVLEVIDESGPR